MAKLFGPFFVFVLGLFLSFAFVYRERLYLNSSNISENYENKKEANEVTEASDLLGATGNEAKKWALAMGQLSPELRVGVLGAAVEQGTPTSLQQIRPEYLELLPDYRQQVLARLKTKALGELILRFTSSDWNNWPMAYQSQGGRPSAAWQYVNNISLVNTELGRFVETAAQLFYAMYLTIMSGQPFELDATLADLRQNAEMLLLNRRALAIPARDQLDPMIATDRSFLEVLERQRCELVRDFIELNPNNLEKHIILISTINLQFCRADVVETVESSIQSLILRATADYRGPMIAVLENSIALKSLSIRSSPLQIAFAQLFSVGAIDALENGRKERALALLTVSKTLYPNLPLQDKVDHYLAKIDRSPQLLTEELQLVKASLSSAPTGSRIAATFEWVSLRGWKFWFFLLFTTVIFFIVLLRLGFIMVARLDPFNPAKITNGGADNENIQQESELIESNESSIERNLELKSN